MSLKELRSRTSSIAKLQEKAKKIGQKNSNSYEDPEADTYWKLRIGKDGKGHARIRFLPNIHDDNAWIQLNSHSFQGPKGWYIENCLSTLGQRDPMVDFYVGLPKEDRKPYEAMKTVRKYVANIQVIEDFADPSNNGKVFRYKFGPVIMEMITEQLVPETDEDGNPLTEERNPFDIDEGMVFDLVYYTKNKFGKYDKSSFEDPTPLADSDEEIERILNKTYSLSTLISEDKFKSYDELKKRLDKILDLEETDKPVTKHQSKLANRRSQIEDDGDDEDHDSEDTPPFDPDGENDNEDVEKSLSALRNRAAAARNRR